MLERIYVQQFYLRWWNCCVTEWGQTCIIRETVGFGGYSVVLRWKSAFWRWNTSAWFLDDAIEDFYALEPGGTTPITCPPVSWGLSYVEQLNTVILGLNIDGNDGTHTGGNFPLQDRPHYRPIPQPAHAYNWQIPLVHDYTFPPAPHC